MSEATEATLPCPEGKIWDCTNELGYLRKPDCRAVATRVHRSYGMHQTPDGGWNLCAWCEEHRPDRAVAPTLIIGTVPPVPSITTKEQATEFYGAPMRLHGGEPLNITAAIHDALDAAERTPPCVVEVAPDTARMSPPPDWEMACWPTEIGEGVDTAKAPNWVHVGGADFTPTPHPFPRVRDFLLSLTGPERAYLVETMTAEEPVWPAGDPSEAVGE